MGYGIITRYPSGTAQLRPPMLLRLNGLDFCYAELSRIPVAKKKKKKELYIYSHTIRFLLIQKPSDVPNDMPLVLGLYSIWRPWVVARHADQKRQTVHVHFIEVLKHVETVLQSREVKPDGAPVLRELIEVK